MKRIFLIGILWLSALAVTYAQQDTKAKKLLDQTTEIYQNAGGVSIHFTGSQNGKLLLDGNRFYLECGGVKSWFDGRTQWSYVSQNEEVTVSNPTEEELQTINPYTWISMYKQSFNYRYAGQKTLKGKSGEEIILTPQKKQDIKYPIDWKGPCSPIHLYRKPSRRQTGNHCPVLPKQPELQ